MSTPATTKDQYKLVMRFERMLSQGNIDLGTVEMTYNLLPGVVVHKALKSAGNRFTCFSGWTNFRYRSTFAFNGRVWFVREYDPNKKSDTIKSIVRFNDGDV